MNWTQLYCEIHCTVKAELKLSLYTATRSICLIVLGELHPQGQSVTKDDVFYFWSTSQLFLSITAWTSCWCCSFLSLPAGGLQWLSTLSTFIHSLPADLSPHSCSDFYKTVNSLYDPMENKQETNLNSFSLPLMIYTMWLKRSLMSLWGLSASFLPSHTSLCAQTTANFLVLRHDIHFSVRIIFLNSVYAIYLIHLLALTTNLFSCFRLRYSKSNPYDEVLWHNIDSLHYIYQSL